MTKVGIHEAKTHFSKLIDRALAGEEIVITRDGGPVARLTPVMEARKPNLGFAAGTIEIAPDFDETPDWFIEEFEK